MGRRENHEVHKDHDPENGFQNASSSFVTFVNFVVQFSLDGDGIISLADEVILR